MNVSGNLKNNQNIQLIAPVIDTRYRHTYHNYLNERRGPHLIFYLLERALIRGGAHISRGAH